MSFLARGKSSLLPALIALIWVHLAPSWAVAQENADLYLLDFHADGYLLAESVPGYASGDTFLIDFALFLDAVEFPIERQGEVWSGWFRDQDRHFVWSMDLGLVQLADHYGEPVESDEWMDTDDGTYLSVNTLERWFDLELNVDLRNQVLTVTSSEPLPFQLWRERMLARYRYRSGGSDDADVIVPDQYHWATLPLVDLSTQLLAQQQDGGRSSSGAASLAVGVDLMKHSVFYAGSFSRSEQSLYDSNSSTNRLTIERTSLTPDTSLFAGARYYILGDIYEPNPNLVVNSGTGRGFRVGRHPSGQSSNVSVVTIAGNAPRGWEVELYRNGALLEFGTVGVDGRYFFPGQETPFGENVFVAKLYGPQGQTREDRQIFWGGGADLAEGDYDFSVSHIDFDQFLLDGTPANVDALPASYSTSLRYAMALTADSQIGGSFTRAGLGNRERNGSYTPTDYLTLFGSRNLGPGLLIGELADQLDAGQAWSLEYLTGFRGQKITIKHLGFNDYRSPATIHREDLDSLNEISLFGQFGADEQHAYTLRLTHRDRTAGASDLRLFNRLSMHFGRFNVTNDLDYGVTSGSGLTSGQLMVASRVRGASLRAQLSYLLTGSDPLRQITASMNWSLGARLSNNFSISKRLTDTRDMYFTNLFSIRIRDYDLTFSLSSDFEDAWSVGAGFNIAFGYDGRRQAFITDGGGLATTGRATMNVFVDDNNDGIRNPGEQPVQWASYRDQETLENSSGTLTLMALPTGRPLQFDMQHLKLDDAFLVPRARTYELTTHAGSDVSIDVAVVMTGDIEGHVVAGSADDRGVRGIIVSLHDAEGREVARTRSEFDGFYSFISVPAGDYEVRVTVNGGRSQLVQPLTLDPHDGYIVLERIYVFE